MNATHLLKSCLAWLLEETADLCAIRLTGTGTLYPSASALWT